MKKGRPLNTLMTDLITEAPTKRDFLINDSSAFMEEGAELFSISRQLDSGMREVEPFSMTGLFHRQLGSVLNIPAPYYDRMRAEYPELLVQNVNGWLARSDSRHMIRTSGGRARAYLSKNYRRIDNIDVMKAILPVIAEISDARVESCEVTETKMYLKVLNPRIEMDVVPGDTVQAGIVISNSEVGLGSVSVVPLVYRLVCKNGLVVNDMRKRKYHTGREIEDNWELFSDETLQADDHAFMLKLSDIVRTAVDEAKFAMVVDKLREAANVKITSHVPDVVELTSRHYGFTKAEETDILQHLITGGDLSLYGLSSAVTRASQDVSDYDRATALEAAGWNIATMPNDIWANVNGGIAA